MAGAWLIVAGGYFIAFLTPGINEWEEIKKGNLSVAVLWGAFVISVAAVVIAVLLK